MCLSRRLATYSTLNSNPRAQANLEHVVVQVEGEMAVLAPGERTRQVDHVE